MEASPFRLDAGLKFDANRLACLQLINQKPIFSAFLKVNFVFLPKRASIIKTRLLLVVDYYVA
jgi:hypothetical protein